MCGTTNPVAMVPLASVAAIPNVVAAAAAILLWSYGIKELRRSTA